MKPINSGK